MTSSQYKAEQQRIEMERQMLNMKLRFIPTKNPKVENNRALSMLAVYEDLVRGYLDPMPSQDKFVKHGVQMYPDPPMLALEGRLRRSYPSFVRQHHFEAAVRARFDHVITGRDTDLQGVDIMILHNGKPFGVALTVATPRAERFNRQKAKRQAIHQQMPMLTLTPDAEVGQFWVHSLGQCKEIERFINAS